MFVLWGYFVLLFVVCVCVCVCVCFEGWGWGGGRVGRVGDEEKKCRI